MQNFSLYPRPFICLARHGETPHSVARQYNGLGDVLLTKNGEHQAKHMAACLSTVSWETILCSPLKRAIQTAGLAGFKNPTNMEEIIEFDYGDYEGQTTNQILDNRPDWDIWKHGCPNGETPQKAGKRLDQAIKAIKDYKGAVLIFSHSHTIRIFTARWLGMPAESGALFAYEPAHLSVVGTHRNRPVIILWNDGSHLLSNKKV